MKRAIDLRRKDYEYSAIEDRNETERTRKNVLIGTFCLGVIVTLGSLALRMFGMLTGGIGRRMG